MIEPYNGRIYDPCCGSSGMFVQSIEFIHAHKSGNGNPSAGSGQGGKLKSDISIYGQESNYTTWRLAKMNLALRAIDGQIAHGDTFHYDRHPDLKADFVLANPPFNISDWGGAARRQTLAVRQAAGRQRQLRLGATEPIGQPLDGSQESAPMIRPVWRSIRPDVLDPMCLYFFMQTSAFMDQVWAEAGNTDTFPYVSLTQQRSLKLSMPRIEKQRAIAQILGTLDDKIELNGRRNETLKAMARADLQVVVRGLSLA